MSTASTIAVTRTINAPSDHVWAAITDIASADRMLSGVLEVTVLTDDGFGVGFSWEETRKMFGKRATETMIVTAVTPGVAYTALAHNGGAVYESSLALHPTGPSTTDLTFTFGAEPAIDATRFERIMMRAFASVGAGATRKMIQVDLDDIAAHVEEASAPDWPTALGFS